MTFTIELAQFGAGMVAGGILVFAGLWLWAIFDQGGWR